MALRAVLDTNVWVSALLWRGNPHKILLRALDGDIKVITSTDILDELERVLRLDKFNLDGEEIKGLLKVVYGVSEIVKISESFDIEIKDEEDRIITDCALNGDADLIVTGDKIC
ncbi:MAG: putative toxin-antitoxin system toxin component, PIN family [Methanocellales archaeon]|nr:putative toxin-antitoxin system toxin component, PIN family [Methanocellales archaeon]